MNFPLGTVVSLNGQIVPNSEAKVSVFDRSYLFGDSVYEVIRTFEGKPFALIEHLQRLRKSAELCQITLSQSDAELERDCLQCIQAVANGSGTDVYVRLILSRGIGKIGFSGKNVEGSTQTTIIAQPLAMFSPDATKAFEKGIALQISPRIRNHPRALDPAAKTGNYLNCVLAFLTAQSQGYEDALMIDQQGFLTEGTTFNLFYVKRGVVATPPLDVGILNGITRKIILDGCIQNRIPCREVRFTPEYLKNADEVFITGSVKEVLPVFKIDQKKIGKGQPGPITRLMRDCLIEAMRNQKQNPKEATL